MTIDSIRKEEFMLGLLVPVFAVIGVTLLNIFDFLYLFFPPLLVAVFLMALFWRKWGASLGMAAFVFISWIIHWFVPIFWNWIMADNMILKKVIR